MEVSDNHKQALAYLDDVESLSLDQLSDALTYKWFRLNTLYHIKDKDGDKVLFTPNVEQELFYLSFTGRDIILKARQLGFTTFKMIWALDDCLFNRDYSAACICHNLSSAKDIFRDKVKYAYQNITDSQRELIEQCGYILPRPVYDRDNSYVFDNGSSIKVGTGNRGGTLQDLHISEFGKICKERPHIAREIVTGAFEAVGKGGTTTIESTAEGREGYFYEYCMESKKIKDIGRKPNELEFGFNFFSWYDRPEYEIDGDIAQALIPYFDELESKHKIKLNDRKKAWYSAKWKTLGDDMRREYPSTADEAFEKIVEGAYYKTQFTQIYKDGRICPSLNNDAKVHTAWDIGVGDSTAIWFYQRIGKQIHLVDYYENSGEGLQHYMKVLKEKGYDYGEHWGPHDIENREFGSEAKSRKDIANEGFVIDGERYRLRFDVVPKKSVDAGIEDVRNLLPRCVFDEVKTDEGVKCLESYRKKWNDKLGTWTDKPLHDNTSHGADAFRYLAVVEAGRAVQSKGAGFASMFN